VLEITKKLRLLDCFCGMGGVSDGFAAENFSVTGIDIIDAPKKLGYSYDFIQADVRKLDGKDFQGYDVIWASPPCRDFTKIGIVVGHRWKVPQNPKNGLELVKIACAFIDGAKPKFWVMENVSRLQKFYDVPARFTGNLGKQMYRSFWGNFPVFLMPQTNRTLVVKSAFGFITHFPRERQLSSWTRAKIPFVCAQAFAQAIKRELLNEVNSG